VLPTTYRIDPIFHSEDQLQTRTKLF